MLRSIVVFTIAVICELASLAVFAAWAAATPAGEMADVIFITFAPLMLLLATSAVALCAFRQKFFWRLATVATIVVISGELWTLETYARGNTRAADQMATAVNNFARIRTGTTPLEWFRGPHDVGTSTEISGVSVGGPSPDDSDSAPN